MSSLPNHYHSIKNNVSRAHPASCQSKLIYSWGCWCRPREVSVPTGYILKEKINRVCTSKTQETKETKKNKNKTQSMQKRVLHSSSCCLCSTKKKRCCLCLFCTPCWSKSSSFLKFKRHPSKVGCCPLKDEIISCGTKCPAEEEDYAHENWCLQPTF